MRLMETILCIFKVFTSYTLLVTFEHHQCIAQNDPSIFLTIDWCRVGALDYYEWKCVKNTINRIKKYSNLDLGNINRLH